MEDKLADGIKSPVVPTRKKTVANLLFNPMSGRRPAWMAYAFAIIVTAAALWVRLIMDIDLGDKQLLSLFLIPIILSAYVGGLGPGLVSTAIAAVGLGYLFIPPKFSFSIGSGTDFVKWTVLIISGTLVSVLSEALHRSRRSAEVSKAQLNLITDAVPALVSYIDANYCYRTVNQAYELWFGLKKEEIVGRHVREVLGEAVWEKVHPYVELVMAGERVFFEQELPYKHGSPRWVQVSYTQDRNDKGQVCGFIVLAQDISRGKRAEKDRELAVDFLRLVNETKNKRDMIQAAVSFFRRHSGCDAVGIRLHEEDDYPYYEVRGFPAEFVLAENSLCSRNDTGEVILDSIGNPVLDCMCGNIIRGRFDPSKSFFTKGGSFWTNSTTELLATTTNADRQARTRNRCNGEGYESVALIALHVGEDRLGLLQLNDLQKGRFLPEEIALWERLAGYLAVALAKFQAEELLRSSEELYRSLFDNMLNGFAYCRMLYLQDQPQDFIYLAVNDAFTTLTGLKDVVGKKVSEVIPGIRDTDPRLFEIYGRVALTGKSERFEMYVDALRMWFWISVYSPRKEHFVAVFDVITERKLAEEALQDSKEKISLILNSTAEGIYGIDLLGNCTFCNPSAIRILCYHDEKDLIGKDIHELIHHTKADGTSYPKAECLAHRAIAKREYIHRDREILWRSDGTNFPAEFWAHPIFKGNELMGTVVTFIDTTERAALENQLFQAQKMEAVGTLAGGIAHDFNNILSAIIGYADLLHMKMPIDDPLRTNVEEILESAERAAQLTHSLLAFSRNQLMTVKAVDLIDLISRMGKMLIRIIGEDIEFKTEFRQKSLSIMADSGQIEQVIMNLATNARDAMPKGGTLSIVTDLAEIEEAACEAHGCDMPGNYAIITVSDTGTGMGEETRKRIFDPFFTTKNIGKGTGLGLSIVYGIVRQHNGFIDVDSEQGKGTIFRIYLPAIPDAADEKTDPTPAQFVDKGIETILMAEDDPALRKLSRIVLESFGYKVILAADGEEAVRKFTVHNEEIGLVILDMMMPKMTGVEAYKAIRNIRPEVKALFLSGYSADKLTGTGLSADGMESIMKPISPRDLLRTVRRVLDN
jgi:PAS domain S-box-containing protein